MARSPSPRVRRTVRSFTTEQLDRCVEIYQPLYDEPLSHEKAGEILHNVTAVYQLQPIKGLNPARQPIR